MVGDASIYIYTLRKRVDELCANVADVISL